MVCVDGVLYLAVQDLCKAKFGIFDEAPAASIYKSTDKGRTWTGTDEPMFSDYVFTTIMFLDYGKNSENCPDDYVYAYGLDYNWRDSFTNQVIDPVNLYLARVHKDHVMDRSKWEFFTGTDGAGQPGWSGDVSKRQAVLHDDRKVYTNMNPAYKGVSSMTVLSQGSIVYNKPLDRYLYTSWTEYTFEFYESPTPYGPWKLFLSKDFGGYPWTSDKHGGYACTIPSKFISADGPGDVGLLRHLYGRGAAVSVHRPPSWCSIRMIPRGRPTRNRRTIWPNRTRFPIPAATATAKKPSSTTTTRRPRKTAGPGK